MTSKPMVGEAQPLISVVVPTYNRADLLAEAIESVRAQDYEHWELLVVDDGSTDDSPAVLERYQHDERVRCFKQPNSGQAVARNKGIFNARGEYVAFLDSDNRWLPDKLRKQVAYLVAHPAVDVLYGEIESIDLEGRVLSGPAKVARHSGEIWRPLLVDNFVNFNTAVVRTSKLREIEGFDEKVRRADDYDLWLRLATHARFQFVPGVVAQYRTAGARISDNIAGRFESNMAAVGRFLARNPGLLAPKEVDELHSRINRRFARAFAGRGQYRQAWARSLEAIRLSPKAPGSWRTLAVVAAEPFRKRSGAGHSGDDIGTRGD